MALPQVLILYTGGTFGMDLYQDHRHHSINLAIPQLSAALLKKRFQNQVPELKYLARCEVEIVLNRDSAHIGPAEWILLAERIEKNWKKYDGIVVLHGTDTLAYTASALSFLLGPCPKPVVMTGAQRPLTALRTDARTNLISAVEIAAQGPRPLVNQVSVFFGDRLFQGNRIRKQSASDFTAFDSPLCTPLARVGTTIRYAESPLKKASRVGKKIKLPRLLPQFSEKVLVAHVTPGFPSAGLTNALLPQLDGIVLVVFHSGTAPTHHPDFLKFLQEAKRLQIPITLTTERTIQPPNSSEDPFLHYAAGKDLLSGGCFWGGTMTPECCYVKTALLLGQMTGKNGQKKRNIRKFAALWLQELANEGC